MTPRQRASRLGGPLGGHTRPLLGLGYLALVLSLMAASIATYRKDLPWQRRVEVTLSTDQVASDCARRPTSSSRASAWARSTPSPPTARAPR